MKKNTVAIVFGGVSPEHEISCISAAYIIRNMNRERYIPHLFGITKQGSWVDMGENGSDVTGPILQSAIANAKEQTGVQAFLHMLDRVDIVFPVLHGRNGEDGTIQGFLQVLDIPYVGSSIVGSAGCMDKSISKAVFKNAGIPCADYRLLIDADYEERKMNILDDIKGQIGFPCFVKPANTGSSIGVAKVYQADQLSQAIEHAFVYDARILVESYVEGSEIECSVLGNEKPRVSLTGRIVSANDFYDYEAKYANENSKTIIPSNLDPSLERKVQAMAVKAYTLMDCAGLARVDFFVNEEKRTVWINEINTIPGFTSISMYPKLWECEGVSASDWIGQLIEYGFLAYEKRKKYEMSY